MGRADDAAPAGTRRANAAAVEHHPTVLLLVHAGPPRIRIMVAGDCWLLVWSGAA
jgi:hypothetical protein